MGIEIEHFFKIVIVELFLLNLVLLAFLLIHTTGKSNKKSKFQIFLKRMWNGFVYYLLWLFPRDKQLIVFSADEGMSFSDNPKYVFLQFKKHPEFRCVWITKNRDVERSMKAEGYECYLCGSVHGIWMQLRAGTLIQDNSIKEEFDWLAVGGATSINLWHGVGLKRVWFRNKNAFSGKWVAAKPSLERAYNLWWAKTNRARRNYVVGTSEEVNAYYPDTYRIKPENVLNLGQARNDIFYDDSLEDKKRLPEVFKRGKVILYMPTYRKYNVRKSSNLEEAGNEIDYEKMSEVLEKYGYTLVLKQHRYNTPKGQNWNKYENIVDISSLNYDLDPQQLLKYTDILITDYSSCYTDFLLLNRPVVFFCPDLAEYLKKWELNFDFDYVTPGPKCFDSDEMIEELEKLIQGQDEYEAERQRVKNVFYSPENQQPVAAKQMEYIIDHIIKPKRKKE